MVRNILSSIVIISVLTGCSSLKSLNFTSNKQATVTEEGKDKYVKSPRKQVQFLEEISVTPQPSAAVEMTSNEPVRTRRNSTVDKSPSDKIENDRMATIEKASAIQLKYAILLNTEVEQLQNQLLLEKIDEWYGTRYRLGGNSKAGIDCSAFVQAIFLGAYAVSLPRTASEQHKSSRRISRTELKEGDLLFFNTTGGISHVGIYLQNNKFVHASVSQGVTVSDIFDSYYVRRFISAGRVDEKQLGLSSN